MKKQILSGVLAIALALLGFQAASVSAQQAPATFSVAVHIEYADGFVYDNVVMTGVSSADLPLALAVCGQGHIGGSAVRFHCYPIHE